MDCLAHSVRCLVDVQKLRDAWICSAVFAGYELDGPRVVFIAGVGQPLGGIEGLRRDDEIWKALRQIHVLRGTYQLGAFNLDELQLLRVGLDVRCRAEQTSVGA